MNLNPIPWVRNKFANRGGDILAATVESMTAAPFSGILGANFVPREVNPHLYEMLREAVPIIDGGIERLCTFDGILRVEFESDALANAMGDWFENVPVNDGEAGLHAFYASQGNELYEQGFAVGEYHLKPGAAGIAGLRVADSKGVHFVRTDAGLDVYYQPPGQRAGLRGDGTDTVERLLRRSYHANGAAGLLAQGFRKLDRSRLVYCVNSPEADNPYGTSKLRSLEFVSQVLLIIENAVMRSWDRYGDPPLHMNYKTKNARLDENQLEARRLKLQKNLASAMKAKMDGNSVDLVTAIGANDELTIDLIGAMGIAMDPEKPSRHMLEQIVSKFGLPAWAMGLQWVTDAGLAAQQFEIIKQESKTRFERRRPGLRRVVETEMRLRGLTWKPGDWQLMQELPSLEDALKMAQANFLTAQTAMMQGEAAEVTTGRGVDNNLRQPRSPSRSKAAKAATDEEAEPFAEDDSELERIERDAIATQLTAWHALRDAALAQLVPTAKAAKAVDSEGNFTFEAGEAIDLLQLGRTFFARSTAPDAPVLASMWEAWVRGRENAAAELSVSGVINDTHQAVRTQLSDQGMTRVRNVMARAYEGRIVGELTSGKYDGMNPDIVAAQLRERFGAGDYDWERLVRSEMTQAQVLGKEEMYREAGFSRYEYVTANDDRVSEVCQENAAGGPYTLGQGPLPMRDSHPNCRCTITAIAD